MSFFAELLAGSISGLGKGIVDRADYDNKLEAQRALQMEKQQAALDLQRQRAEDRAFQIQLAADSKAAARGGSSGSAADLWDEVAAAQADPAKAEALIARAELLGDNVQGMVAKVLGRGGSLADVNRMPTEQDVIASMATDGKEYTPQAPIDPEKSAAFAEKGRQEFSRGFALLANKGDTKGNAQGEAQYFENDARATAMEQALRSGKPLVDASAYASRVADPAAYDKNQTEANKVRNTTERTALQGEIANLKTDIASARAGEKSEAELDKLILDYEKLKKDERKPEKIANYDAAILEFKVRKKAMRDVAAPAQAPAKPSSNWTTTGSTPTQVANSLAKFSQFRQGQPAR